MQYSHRFITQSLCSIGLSILLLSVSIFTPFSIASVDPEVQDKLKHEETININTADAETLAVGLAGIGLAKARAIVAWREAQGNFTSVDQLTQVKGIGEAILAKNAKKIRLR